MTITEPDDGKSYGMSAVANWVEEDEFPLTKDDLRSRFGDKEIMLSYEEEVRFSEVLDEVTQDEYEDIVDLWGSLGDAFREIDEKVQRRYL
ncbi:MAG: DUF5785 family protein [Halobacteria archaeon]|nr:DUF5785 family protein [Halobacteria archaeon]